MPRNLSLSPRNRNIFKANNVQSNEIDDIITKVQKLPKAYSNTFRNNFQIGTLGQQNDQFPEYRRKFILKPSDPWQSVIKKEAENYELDLLKQKVQKKVDQEKYRNELIQQIDTQRSNKIISLKQKEEDKRQIQENLKKYSDEQHNLMQKSLKQREEDRMRWIQYRQQKEKEMQDAEAQKLRYQQKIQQKFKHDQEQEIIERQHTIDRRIQNMRENKKLIEEKEMKTKNQSIQFKRDEIDLIKKQKSLMRQQDLQRFRIISKGLQFNQTPDQSLNLKKLTKLSQNELELTLENLKKNYYSNQLRQQIKEKSEFQAKSQQLSPKEQSYHQVLFAQLIKTMAQKVAQSPVNLQGIVLHPYIEEMVLKYHSWQLQSRMQDPFLLQMTSSEPQTLEQEYEAQKSWLIDPKKYTWIILDEQLYQQDIPQSMIGDINLFINNQQEGEINVMIAEAQYRRRGIAEQAIQFVIQFARDLALVGIWAKIQTTNSPSIELFKKLGFAYYTEIEDFDEVHYWLDFNTI